MTTLVPIATGLTVRIRYGKGTKVKTISHVNVWLGDMPVASHTLVGRYSEVQALQELKKNPAKWMKHHAYQSALDARLL